MKKPTVVTVFATQSYRKYVSTLLISSNKYLLLDIFSISIFTPETGLHNES